MALNLNDTRIVPREGLYVYMPNAPEPHNCIVGASQTLKAGDIVTLDTTATNNNCPVVKKAGVTDVIFGVVPFDALKDTYVANDKISIAIEGSTIYKTASGAVTPMATLYFTAQGKITATATAGNSTLGTANAYAGDGEFVQVKLKFGTTQSAE